jgi:hypothetical protein
VTHADAAARDARRALAFIEVEIGTYCNRVCTWCPNGWHDRGKERLSMADDTWRALLADLASRAWGPRGYAGRFAFHNYNEPMADPRLLERIADARRAMPDAKLRIYTNGDYLNPARVQELKRAGVDHVNVTLYPRDEDAFAPPDARAIDRFLAKIDAVRGVRGEKATKLVHSTRVGRMRVVVRVPKIEHYTDRGGSVELVQLGARAKLPQGVRTAPCDLPVSAAAIDVHGALKLCCHIYDTTRAENAPYVFGHVGTTPFSVLWTSAALERTRAQLLRADFAGLAACAACTHTPT